MNVLYTKIKEPTFLGRLQYSLKIETKCCSCFHKSKTIFFSGIHAREWIGPAVATYLIHMLAEDENEGSPYTSYFNFYINPVYNADGYEYSRMSAGRNVD